MKSKFFKRDSIRKFIYIQNPKVKLSPGFIKLIELHLEAILKRSTLKPGNNYLDANDALMACRYSYHVMNSKMEYRP